MYKKDIRITSYNFEKTVEADQETAIEMHISEIKEHSFILDINSNKYELKKTSIKTDYQISAMEDELYEEKGHVSDSTDIHFKSHDKLIIIADKDMNEKLNTFLNFLIKESENNNIGCTEERHLSCYGTKNIQPKENNELLLIDVDIPEEISSVILYTESKKEKIQSVLPKKTKQKFKF